MNSKSKSLLGMYAMIGIMSAMDSSMYGSYKKTPTEPKETDEKKKLRLSEITPTEPKETDEKKKLRLSEIEAKINKVNGLKEFLYGENIVWAINQKTADKKARKNNWL